MTRTWRFLTVFGFVVVLGGLSASAQQVTVAAPQQPPTTQGPATQQANPAAPQTPVIVERYTVGQARPPVAEGAELIELTLEQAYALALEKNLELKVARMEPVKTDYSKQSLIAAYRPNFSGSYSYSNSLTPSNSTLDGVLSVTNTSQSYGANVSQGIRWYGAPSFQVGFSNGRSATNNVTARLNPSFNTRLNLSGSMNLTNQFKMDHTRNSWRTFPSTGKSRTSRCSTRSRRPVRASAMPTGTLRSAIEQIEISRRALELANKVLVRQFDQGRNRNGCLDRHRHVRTAGRTERASAMAAQNSWTTAELTFKRLLVSGTDDRCTERTINPTDRPELSVSNVDIQAAVTRTLQQGTNLLLARKRIDITRYGLELTKANLMPTVTVNGG
jgi:hypothetical protein